MIKPTHYLTLMKKDPLCSMDDKLIDSEDLHLSDEIIMFVRYGIQNVLRQARALQVVEDLKESMGYDEGEPVRERLNQVPKRLFEKPEH